MRDTFTIPKGCKRQVVSTERKVARSPPGVNSDDHACKPRCGTIRLRSASGQRRRPRPVRQKSAYPLTAAEWQTSLNRRLGPTHKVAALQPAAREQEPRGR
jgi:hypothetical protein